MKEVRRKHKLPPPSATERILSHVMPGTALNMYRKRCAFSVMSGAYKGADKKRRSFAQWNVPGADFDTDVLPELQTLRENSEDLYRNNMVAAGSINTECTSVVGRGLTVQPRIDAEFLKLTEEQADKLETAISREWLLWSESKFCTVNMKHNFREFQNIAFLSSLIRGDSFTLTPEKSPLPYYPFSLRLQLVEADRVCNEDNQPDSDTLSGGIETEADGAPKYLHVMKHHPGSTRHTDRMVWAKVPFFGAKTGRRNVLQFYKTIRADQSRGVPVLSPVIEGLKQFGTLTQANIDAAVVQTFLAVFIETESARGFDLPTGDTSTSDSESVKLESAAIIDLAEGEKPHFVNPTHPNANFNIFAQEFYTMIGMALQIPHEIMTKYFQSSYTAAQGALMEAWRYFMTRRSAISDNVCQPVYELFLADVVSSNRIQMPGFFVNPLVRAAYSGADWVGSPRGHIREDVQNKADGYAEDRGWKTLEQNTQERGGRWERNHRQRVKEIKKRRDDGITTTEENLEQIEEIRE